MRIGEDLEMLTAAYHQGRTIALLFDFDGTLAPLVTHPDLAACSKAMEELLVSLAGLPRVIVGVLSGRTLENLKTKICLPKLVYGGTFGLELELPQGVREHPDARRYAPVVTAAKGVIERVIQDFPGAWIEEKPLAFTVHYRQVNREEVAFLQQCVEAKLGSFGGVVVSVDGSMAIEALPDVGWDKGEALHTILDEDGRDAIPLYAGNDDNDAGAMQAALERGGLAIGIGPAAPPLASRMLPDTQALEELIGELLNGLRKAGCGSKPPKAGAGPTTAGNPRIDS
jgi:trehalose-phosphatase